VRGPEIAVHFERLTIPRDSFVVIAVEVEGMSRLADNYQRQRIELFGAIQLLFGTIEFCFVR
jgi:hypothetical protein